MSISIRSIALVFALATVLIALVMMGTFPTKAELPSGYHTPIIAFEFARSDSDVAYLMDSGHDGIENRQRMRDGHQWDMIFPFAYAGFLVFLLLSLKIRNRIRAVTAVAIALSIILFDIYENLSLLAVITAIETDSLTAAHFSQLHAATWLKWAAIGLMIGLIAVVALKREKWVIGTAGVLHALLTVLCWLSDSRPLLVEAMALSVSIFMVLAIGWLLRDIARRQRKSA